MPLYEILISGIDKPEDHQVDQGDILDVFQYPHDWGRKEIDIGLVLIVESSSSYEEMKALKDKLYPDDETEEEAADRGHNPIKKRKYQVPLSLLRTGWIPDLDFNKVINQDYIYQPFKKSNELVQKFDGLNGNRLLRDHEVDCYSSIADTDIEIVINIDEPVSFAINKNLGTFRFSTVKEID